MVKLVLQEMWAFYTFRIIIVSSLKLKVFQPEVDESSQHSHILFLQGPVPHFPPYNVLTSGHYHYFSPRQGSRQ
jgi:hypothetical protein